MAYKLWQYLVLIGLPSVVAAAPINLKEGWWETNVVVEVEGGSFPMPAIRSSKCLTQQDPIPNSVQSNMQCQVTDHNITGDVVNWRIECGDERATMEGVGKITFTGDSYDGNMDVIIKENGGDRSVKMKYIMHGDRQGNCDGQDKR
jgi:hypothetical protein